jgi:arginase
VYHHPVTILGIPFDANASFMRGASKGPDAIRRVLHNGSANLCTEQVLDLSTLSFWEDAGNITFENDKPEAAFHTIKSSVAAHLKAGKRVLSLGGDHSVAYPIMAAYAEHYPTLHLLQIDAHSDLYDDFEGNPYSHASPFARILENKLAASLTQIGIRTLNPHQRAQAARFEVNIVEMKDFKADQLPTLHGPLYISIDLDGFDPAFAPGVAHHEPGGLTVREVLHILSSIDVTVVGADIVELCPHRDHHDMTAMLGAKLLKELLGLLCIPARTSS